MGEARAEVTSSEVDIHVLEIYCGVFSGATSVEKGRKQEWQRGKLGIFTMASTKHAREL